MSNAVLYTVFKIVESTIAGIEVIRYLLWLLFTNVCSSQHGGFDSRENLQLSTYGRDSFTHLWEEREH